MEFVLHNDQELLQRTFRTFFEEQCSLDRVRFARDAGGFDEDTWKRFVAIGGHNLSVPEDCKGGGGSLLDAVLVAVEAGRALAPIPFSETSVALRAVARGGSSVVDGSNGEPWAIALRPEVRLAGDLVTGVSGWTTSGANAGLILLRLGDSELGVVYGEAATRHPVENLAGLPAATLSFDKTETIARWSCPPEMIAVAQAEYRLLLAAELVGCGRRALDLCRSYVTERRQFGSPIGSFQAVQHRLVDCLIGLDAAELLVVRAAAYEKEPKALAWRSAVAAACASDMVEKTTSEALQFFGGYGFTVECDIQLFLRFAKALAVVLRDGSCLLDDVLTSPEHSVTELGHASHVAGGFRRGPAEEQFRQEVNRFLDTHLTPKAHDRIRRMGEGYDAEFHRAMAEKRWILASLPPQDGGIGLDPGRVAVLWESLYYADAPIGAQQLTEIVASIVAQVGTSEQRDLILGPALAGDLLCAIGYTEPDAGSDVASVRTTAERRDGGYLVNGNKMFTTMAQVAEYVFLLARTEPKAAKHQGLTTLLVPLRQDGVEIVPIPTLAGEQTNATFYSDVFVPKSLRVGAESEGWAVLNRGLAVERASLGGFVGRLRRLYDDLLSALDARNRRADPVSRIALAEATVAIEAAAALCDRVYCRSTETKTLDVEAAMAKIVATESLKQLAQRSLDLVGPDALASGEQSGDLVEERLERMFRHAQVATIYAGTSEVLRNLIAQRGLGLPRSEPQTR